MKFPHTYFEDELREGFYVPGIIKRGWAAQIEVLQLISDICKKHNIKWFADCGTLLGAVRHGGFIPWDDDLDICMLRPDYIRFNRIIRKELPEDYVVLNLNNEGEDMYFENLTRITNGHRLNFDPEFLEKYHQFPYASGIDIFPIDYISAHEEEENQRKELSRYMLAIAENMADDGSDADIYKDDIANIEAICDRKIDFSQNVKRQLYQLIEMVFSLYSDIGGEYVALMPYWVHKNNHKYPAKLFDSVLMMPFETIEIPVPAAYDAVLRIEYDNYMKIYKNGGVHGYPFFTSQEYHLIKQVNVYPFKYKFSKQDLENPARASYVKPRTQAIQFLQLMREAHFSLVKIISDGQYREAAALLTTCQDSAIQIGNLIESRYGEGNLAVQVLEQYCEVLYQIFEMLQESENTDTVINTEDLTGFLGEITELFEESIKKAMPDRKEILFIGCKADAWKSFSDVYRAAGADSDCDVYVMPVPYYDRNALGAKMNGYYEGADYPEYVHITDYTQYDIKKRHPDVIFIQNPYDGCNYTTCVDKEYFSSNLKMYTDKLVYIPWFRLDEIEEDNLKAKKVMEYYCQMPALAHSDVVFVQSEAMKKEYIECLTKFAGEDTREIWENKIHVSDFSVVDTVYAGVTEDEKKDCLKKLPEKWSSMITRPDGTLKKVILYTTNVASIIEHGEGMIDKISSVFDTFKDRQEDVALIFRPHPLTRATVMTVNPKLARKFTALVDNYCAEGWGIYDDTEDMNVVSGLCDAYYGDADMLARRCEYLGKPVMLQKTDVQTQV